MDDKEYKSLALRSAICPNLERWPTDTTHWLALVRAGGEMRKLVGKTQAAIEAVNADKSLSAEGKREKKREIGTKALNEMETGTSLVKAREAVMAQMKRWAEKVAVHVKPAEDHAEAIMHAQIRAKIADMKENRFGFLQKHAAADPQIAAALLSAPPFLSGLSESELALLRIEVEKKCLGPEVSEAKDQVADALLEAERSLRAGQAMIRNSAGVEKPTAAELAMARPRVA